MNDISVVITCFSEGRLILEAIESIREQSLSALEIILVNDASTDLETNRVCQELEDDPFVNVIWRQLNGGPSEARNDGFQAASGNIIVPLDADDLLPPQALEIIHNTFHDHPDAGFIYGSYIRQDRIDVPGKLVFPGDISLQAMLKSKPFSLSSNWKLIGTTPFRKSILSIVGFYNTDFGVDSLHDVEFWMRILASKCPYYSVSKPIYLWRKYLGSNSRLVTPLAWYEIVKAHFSIYTDVDLEYRAYELLLLGSKWMNNRAQSQIYSSHLLRCMKKGRFEVSSLLALMLPSFSVHILATFLQKNR